MKRYQVLILTGCCLMIISLSLVAVGRAAETSEKLSPILTILHFNDSHSFWYPHDRRDWGGFARMAAKIKELKASIPNPVLVMNGGDTIEGRFYSRGGGGVDDLKVLDAMGVDYIVIGNHDWLIGPYNQYFVFSKARPRLKILACNLQYTVFDSGSDKYRDLPPEFSLQRFIKPYDIVETQGKKVGILGITTYDLIYDAYYFPVTIRDPNYAVPETVNTLLNTEGCDYLIALSHLGLDSDHALFDSTPIYCPGDGISVIVGAHSHDKVYPEQSDGACQYSTTKRPAEIVQAWAHGRLLGRFDIDLSNYSNPIQNYTFYQIDDTITPDPEVADLIDTLSLRMMQKQNIYDDDVVLTTNVDLEDASTETRLANLICDSYLWRLNNSGYQTDFTMFNCEFIGDHLQRTKFLPAPDDDYAEFSSVDLYNVIPHIYDPSRKVSWLLSTYQIWGFELKTLMGIVFGQTYINMSSNVELVYDNSKFNRDAPERSIDSFRINGQNVDNFKLYTFAVDEGLIAALDQLNFHPQEVTSLEAWKAFRDYVSTQIGTISQGINSDINGRVRTAQPDPAVFSGTVSFSPRNPQVGDQVTVQAIIRNWGNQTASSVSVDFYFDKTPESFIDDPSYSQIGSTQVLSNLLPAPADARTVSVIWDTTTREPGLYSLYCKVSNIPGEANTANNFTTTYIELF